MSSIGLTMAFFMSVASPTPQDIAPGISKALAEKRSAKISNTRYRLTFHLRENSETVEGHAIIDFDLPQEEIPKDPVILDFAGKNISEILINGTSHKGNIGHIHNHLILPAAALNSGTNSFEAQFVSRVSATGTPLTVYRDARNGEEFLYTLAVPADAHRLFPCFDQPDLKANFKLSLTAPKKWAVVANAPAKGPGEEIEEDRVRWEFGETKPLSTYLMAFAAGPFHVVEGPRMTGRSNAAPMRIFLRRSRLKDLDQASLFSMHRRSLEWLESYFDVPYPFEKLDIVLAPGFPYGGMEHAGAIFYRESAIVFDHEPTVGELTRRSTLIYHEVSHQWFGNLVSFVWFDDLWLKEGFATFVGYRLVEALEPKKNAWLRFSQRVKPRAYNIDATLGTTPVYQALDNLADAKSTYGPIVYNKAPAVLRELEARIGPASFRLGLQIFLKRHAFKNARWQDLLAALSQTTKIDLRSWSQTWILTAGMPRVQAQWSATNGQISKFEILQASVQGNETTWPLKVDLLLFDEQGHRKITVETHDAVTELVELVGTAEPSGVLLNPRDIAYGQFLLDKESQDFLLSRLGKEDDLLLRAVTLSSLFETVRDGGMDPSRYAKSAIQLIEKERDPESHQWLLSSLSTTLGRYLSSSQSEPLLSKLVTLLHGQLRAGMPGLELQTFRFLARHGTQIPAVMKLCEDLLDKKVSIPGLTLGTRDRFTALAALLANGRGQERLEAMVRSEGGDVSRWAYQARAAIADAATKQRYFESYLDPDKPPEQWMGGSLPFFHWPGQEELTLPWLQPALDKLEWVKANRKIFFMPAWIDGFVNGHSDRAALQVVDAVLEDNTEMAPDIRLKLLQSVDSLRRAVKIKERWK